MLPERIEALSVGDAMGAGSGGQLRIDGVGTEKESYTKNE